MKKNPSWTNIGVVISDPFGKNQLALHKAAAIASHYGARLTLFNSFMLPQPTPDTVLGLNKENIEVSRRDRQHRLERLAAPLQRRGLKVDCIVHWDFPVQDAIVRYVLRHKPDLLIAESHRRGRLARWVLANTDWELIRNCPCPIWFVRSSALPQRLKILVAVDPRHAHDKPAKLDSRLLNAAEAMAARLNGKLAVVHAYETPVTTVPGTFMEPFRVAIAPQKARKFVTDTKRRVDALVRHHSIPTESRFVREGDAAYVVQQIARQFKADVLVMGAVSRRMVQRPFIGNTAEKVIDQVSCDVFVVKPVGFKTVVRRAQPKV